VPVACGVNLNVAADVPEIVSVPVACGVNRKVVAAVPVTSVTGTAAL